jgi:hypothetical protein
MAMFSNKLYDFLRRSATLILPAAGTLYFTLAQIWGLPNGEAVVGSIAAVNVFIGILVQLSKRSYNNSDARYDGSLDITSKDDGTKVFMLNVGKNPEVLETQPHVTFKVNNG